MAAAGGKLGQGQDPARFVYVTRFGSHRCGGVLQLGGRRAEGRRSPGLQAGGSLEEPREAAAGTRGGGDLLPGPEPRGPAASSVARASSARSGGKSAARAGLIQKTLVKKYDFPIPFNEASKIMKKKKKVSVWKKVHKLICRMLEENEKYRLRLKGQRLSSTQTAQDESPYHLLDLYQFFCSLVMWCLSLYHIKVLGGPKKLEGKETKIKLPGHSLLLPPEVEGPVSHPG